MVWISWMDRMGWRKTHLGGFGGVRCIKTLGFICFVDSLCEVSVALYNINVKCRVGGKVV